MACKTISRSDVENNLVEFYFEQGIKKTDSLDNLVCFSGDLPPTSDFESQIRGCVFNNDTLIVKSNPFANELSEDDAAGFDITKFRISTMNEGTMIRVFYFENKWYITTNRKLDAFKSKWGKTSFGDLFVHSVKATLSLELEDFLDILNKNRVYFFLIGTNEETRIVSPAKTRLEFVECRENGAVVFECENLMLAKLYQRTFEFVDFEDAFKWVQSLSFPFQNGFGLYLSNDDVCFKITNNKYRELADLRHNLVSIKFAYIHNMFDDKKSALFKSLYPLHVNDFVKYDRIVEALVHILHEEYVSRFVFKNNTILSKPENAILYNIHGLYLEYKVPITKDLVYYVLSISKPPLLNKLISEWDYAN